MANLHILREHALGLAAARKIAFAWAEQVEGEFDMACTYEEGKTSDTVTFTRSGVNGTLQVTKDRFELTPSWAFCWGHSKTALKRKSSRTWMPCWQTKQHQKQPPRRRQRQKNSTWVESSAMKFVAAYACCVRAESVFSLKIQSGLRIVAWPLCCRCP